MRLYHNQPAGTVTRARSLRRDASPVERTLLRALRETHPHLKWRHQSPICPYYADILCFAERLVIEIDGDSHAGTQSYDARRTHFIEGEGYRVARFTNREVLENLTGVLESIALTLRGCAALPSPPGRGREARSAGRVRATQPPATA